MITVDALRADAVGATPAGSSSSATPNLDRLAQRARWAGSAVAPASESAPALASILTGLRPWQHGVLHGGNGELTPSVRTLAEALKHEGYATYAYVSGYWPSRGSGYEQGFDTYRPTGRGKRASGHIESLGDDPTFVWVHLDAPRPPFRLKTKASERFTEKDLEPFRNPRWPMPAQLQSRIWPSYLSNVTRLDRQIGRLLDAAAANRAAGRTVIAFTSLHGEEFGDQGQVGHGNNLGRAVLEVPLILQTPASAPLAAPPAGSLVGSRQLFSTLMDLAGAAQAPALAPSLGSDAANGVISEHYLGNGLNLFSLVQEDGARAHRQLLRRVRFANGEGDYFRARRVAQLRRGPGQSAAQSSLDEIFGRLEMSFQTVPPFSGRGGAVVHQLFSWPQASEGQAPSPRHRDPGMQSEMAADLERRWRAFVAPEVAPAQRSLTTP